MILFIIPLHLNVGGSNNWEEKKEQRRRKTQERQGYRIRQELLTHQGKQLESVKDDDKDGDGGWRMRDERVGFEVQICIDVS